MAELVQHLGWDDKGYPMDMPRGARPPTLRIASCSTDEINDWESSLNKFAVMQSKHMKDTLKGRPSTTGITAGTGKSMYWVGLVPYNPDYSNRSRHATSLEVETDGDHSDDEQNDDNDDERQ